MKQLGKSLESKYRYMDNNYIRIKVVCSLPKHNCNCCKYLLSLKECLLFEKDISDFIPCKECLSARKNGIKSKHDTKIELEFQVHKNDCYKCEQYEFPGFDFCTLFYRHVPDIVPCQECLDARKNKI